MRPQILMLTIACLAATPAWAGAGLTSAGVDPTSTNNQPAEPTLAQVAPQGTQGTTGTSAATVTPGVNSATAAQGGAAVTGVGNGAANGAAVVPVIVTPPPPPDPATLPVSVIRPVSKAATDSLTDTATGRAGVDSSVSPLQPRAQKMPAAPRPGATTAGAPSSPPASSPASLRTSATAVAPRADAAVRPASETTPEEPANAGSSGFIFYSGVGIAAIILLLSLAAFFRGGGGEPGKPRSM
ncbi:MAG TPA: hypothetical protein VGH81_08720 [Rudaea sp.]